MVNAQVKNGILSASKDHHLMCQEYRCTEKRSVKSKSKQGTFMSMIYDYLVVRMLSPCAPRLRWEKGAVVELTRGRVCLLLAESAEDVGDGPVESS